MTLPTKLILLRILLIPMFLTFFFSDWKFGRMVALGIFAVASLTDFFDGRIARARDQVTNFYTFMDPLADKLLISSALIALVWANEIAAWLAILIICRDFIITGFRLFAASQNAVLGAVVTGKFNTFFQMLLILFILASFNGDWADWAQQILIYIVAALTIISTAENFIRHRKVFKRIKL